MEELDQETFDKTDAVSDSIVKYSLDTIRERGLEAKEEIVVLTDVVSTLFAAMLCRYQKTARPRIENLVVTLMHSKAAAFDEANIEIFTGKRSLN